MRNNQAKAALVFGGIALAVLIWILLFGPNELPAYKHRPLGILCAILCGLFGYFFTGSIRIIAVGNFSQFGKVSIQAGGGIGLFVLVLLWWNSGQNPIREMEGEIRDVKNGIKEVRAAVAPIPKISDSIEEVKTNVGSIKTTVNSLPEAVAKLVYEKSNLQPAIPWMEIATMTGLTAQTLGGTITSEMTALYRQHRFVIRNTNRFDLRNFDLWVRLPEPIAEEIPKFIDSSSEIPVGVRFAWSRQDLKMRSTGVNGGSVSFWQRPTRQWGLQIDTIPALTSAAFLFITIPSDTNGPSRGLTDTNSRALINYVLGNFQYSTSEGWRTQEVVMAILFDRTNRVFHSLPPENNRTNWSIDTSSGLGW